ncbi:MAG TPA: FTR1 family protein [Candidatus Krumholzibacteriaceae bacterium]|nr:FTR1 family protein [Candidatus Krumholzibacteriaceae bacterium]
MYETLFPSLIITFREALEAALIVTIMVTYLRKIGKQELNKYSYLGAGSAIVVSLLVGVGLQKLYGGLGDTAGQLFEGVASLTAVVVLTSMIFWMTKHSKEIKGELEGKIEQAVTRGELYGIAALSFIAVAREGLETVLFLSATFIQDQVGTIIGALIGALIVLGISVLLMKGTVNLEISRFFKVTSVLLLVFGAGLAGYGVHELIEAGEGSGIDFGVLGEKPFDINPPVNTDGTYPLLHEKGVIGSVLKALVGYDGNPEWLRIIVYIGYWIVIGTYLYNKY